MKILKRQIKDKVLAHLIDNQVDLLKANIIASRTEDPEIALKMSGHSLQNVTKPNLLQNIDKATERIVRAIRDKEIIGIETDYDCDGQTSHAVLYKAFVDIFQHPEDRLKSYIGNRMEDGYGLTKNVVDKILVDQPAIIITADNGSTDEASIRRLKQAGIDVIVTDHHSVLEAPKSCYAFINPTQGGGDPHVAGCMVAWLLVSSVAINLGLTKNSQKLGDLLDYVAVGTLADCVSLSESISNRSVVHFGLRRLNMKNRVAWQALQEEDISPQFVKFNLAPLLNSASRVADVFIGVKFLVGNDLEQAKLYLKELENNNKARKEMQLDIMEEALEQYLLDHQSLANNTICMVLTNGHAGINGIVASKMREKFGKPTALFAHRNGLYVGSMRTIEGINVKQVLDSLYTENNNLIIKYGGHKGAAGLSVKPEKFKEFSLLFEKEVSKLLMNGNTEVGAVIYHDGPLQVSCYKGALQTIKSLEPFGQNFESPIFFDEAEILDTRFINDKHALLTIRVNNHVFKAFYFDVDTKKPMPTSCSVAYELSEDRFNKKEPMIIIRHMRENL